MFDFPALNLAKLKPMSAGCSIEQGCSETGSPAMFAPMLHEHERCSALLTRDGFFDFVIFRTQCNISYPVALVCQHNRKLSTVFNNEKSDVKVFKVNGFYSLQVFSVCDVGWFMVDDLYTFAKIVNATKVQMSNVINEGLIGLTKYFNMLPSRHQEIV